MSFHGANENAVQSPLCDYVDNREMPGPIGDDALISTKRGNAWISNVPFSIADTFLVHAWNTRSSSLVERAFRKAWEASVPGCGSTLGITIGDNITESQSLHGPSNAGPPLKRPR